MTALPVAFYLKDLSGETSRRRGAGLPGAEEASDLDFQLKEAYARGLSEGRAAARAEQEAAAAAQASTFDQRLAAERQTWAQEQGERLGTLVGAAFEDLERRVSDQVSDTLKPILREQIRVKAVEELAHLLNGMLSRGGYAKISIAGPADLVERLRVRVAAEHAGLSFVETAEVDVTVRADETILATQIGAWADTLSGSGP